MNDSTVPGCLDNFGNPTFGNGPCSLCDWKETCRKATSMRKKIETLQGAEAK